MFGVSILSNRLREILQPKSLTADLYLAGLFMIAAIPASIWVPFKVAIVALILAAVAIALVDPDRRRSVTTAGGFCVLAYLSLLAGLAGYTIYTQRVELSSVLSAAGRYAVVPMLAFAGYSLIEWKYVSSKAILQTMFIGHLGYTIIKVVALIAVRVSELTPEEIIDIASIVVPAATIHGFSGDNVYVRIFMGNDAVAPIMIGLYLLSIRHNVIPRPWWGDLFLVLNAVVVALAFTRFVWMLTAIVILAFIVIYKPSITKRIALRIFLGTALAATTVAFVLSWGGSETGMISERIGDTASLDEKALQVKLMLSSFYEFPLLGKGIGSHLEGHLRQTELDFQYEVQWLALLMQMGFFGFVALSIIATTPLWPMVHRHGKCVLDRDVFYIALIYGLWLSGAFTNPYLFILNSSLVYLGCLAMSKALLHHSNEARDPVLKEAAV